MKKYRLLTIFLMSIYSISLFAADQATAVAPQANTQNAPSLQQQLQNIQSSMTEDQTTTVTSTAPAAKPLANANTVAPVATANIPAPTVQTVQAPAQVAANTQQPTTTTSVTVNNNTTTHEYVMPPDPNADLRDQAFANMTNSTLPLSPSQIETLRGLYDATQRASAVFPGTPPKPISTSMVVDLSPGQTPPIIRLQAGFVTSLVFVDSTGAPWPIEAYSLGNPSAFNIQWDKKSNILLVQAITSHRIANLAVILKGLNTPVMINLTPGQAAMDTRVDLRIPGFGPSAKRPTFAGGLPGTESPYLVNLLDGIPPDGAKALKTTGCEDCAWLLNGKLYLRMPYTLLSPGWISTLSSADGTNVYELQPTPLLLASYNGKTIKIRIEGF